METHINGNITPDMDLISDRLKPWTLSQTFISGGTVVGAYLATILAIRIMMRKQKPFEMKNMMLYYNLIQVAFSAYTGFETAKLIRTYGLFSIRCPSGQRYLDMQKSIFLFFIAKHLDLFDTIFFALRKKGRQLTFLHIYHHAAMVLWVWMIYVHHETDHHIFSGFLNSVVHFVMYLYYLLASLGPKFEKYIWWKKYLTKFQLVQFLLIVSHLVIQHQITQCPTPQYLFYYTLSNPMIFFALFMNFYTKKYKKDINVKSN